MGIRATENGTNSGFTLIELVVVVGLIAIVSLVAVKRLDSISGWGQKTSLRNFTNTWEFLFTQSLSKREQYRLIIDFDRNSYYVRREVPLVAKGPKEVDYLQNLKKKSGAEIAKRQAAGDERLASLDEELRLEDQAQGESLQESFYRSMYADTFSNIRLAIPTSFPKLAKEVPLGEGLRFEEVIIGSSVINKGRAEIRFSSRGASDMALIQFSTPQGSFSMLGDPAVGSIKILKDDKRHAFGRR